MLEYMCKDSSNDINFLFGNIIDFVGFPVQVFISSNFSSSQLDCVTVSSKHIIHTWVFRLHVLPLQSYWKLSGGTELDFQAVLTCCASTVQIILTHSQRFSCWLLNPSCGIAGDRMRAFAVVGHLSFWLGYYPSWLCQFTSLTCCWTSVFLFRWLYCVQYLTKNTTLCNVMFPTYPHISTHLTVTETQETADLTETYYRIRS